MSNTKTVMGQASNTLTAPLNVEDVFSTYLYEGNGSTQTITNGVDLDGEGGIVWIKSRNQISDNLLFDTERGAGNFIRSNTTEANYTYSLDARLTSFNSDGFSLGNDNPNYSNWTYASWSFRKAPKFFDVVTYTGTGSAQTIAHNLGCDVGCIIIKRTDTTGNWQVGFPEQGSLDWVYGILELTNSMPSASYGQLFLGSKPTGNSIDLIGDNTGWNASGGSYVMYLFAHNDGDGGFGADGDADIIKCGSYTGNSGGAINVELGFEPQWIMIKNASSSSNWVVLDVMRGFSWNAGDNLVLNANADYAEQDVDENGAPRPTPTGFSLASSNQYGEYNFGSDTYIYIAIRRGTKVPESATEVFEPTTRGGSAPRFSTGFPVDLHIRTNRNGGSNIVYDRFGIQLLTDSTAAGGSAPAGYFASNEGVDMSSGGVETNEMSWNWKRAPGYFDAVAYSGDGVAGHTVSHNLGVAPEMMWVKARSKIEDWSVYHAGITNPEQNYLYLNSTSALNPNSNTIRYWNHTNPTDSVFTLGDESRVNGSGHTYIAYLFASLPGISKVGSYVGSYPTSQTQTIDCGFTTGARFVLIKASSRSGAWAVWDTARGITVSDDPWLELNSTGAEQTNPNIDVEPNNSGFIIDSASGEFNEVGETYIFYAIA